MLIVLHGQDSFRIHERARALRQAFIEKYDPKGLNVSAVDLKDVDVAVLHQQLSSQGLFSTKRFVVLRGLEGMPRSIAAQLLRDCTTLPDDIIVVCIIPTISELQSELQNTIKQSAKVELYDELDSTAMEQWIRKRLSAVNVAITEPALLYFFQAVESDLWLVSSVIAQLVHVGETITPEIIRRYVTSPLDDNIFHFTDALAKKETELALRLLHEQLQSGTSPIYILTMLARQIELLMQVKETPTTTPGHPYAVQKARQYAQHFDLAELQRLHSELVELDWQLKRGGHDPAVVLDRWVIKATTT